MKYAIINSQTSDSCRAALENLGLEVIALPRAHYIGTSLSYHPDMIIFIGFGRLFCHEKYYADNSALIEKIAAVQSLEIVLSQEDTSDKYPSDVLFNAALVGNNLICNTKHISRKLLEVAESHGANIIHVPQGYSKCNSCIVTSDALITSDMSIYKACIANGIDVLLISAGSISLPDYDYGFVGGACGVCGDFLCFCGDVSAHPDFDKISKFCKKHGKSFLSLSDEALCDMGSIFFL